MQTIPLYRYTRPDGGVTISTVKPSVDYTELTRLVADEGYTLTNGTETSSCVDTATPGEWTEILDREESTIEQKAQAYDILTGVSE